MSQPVGKSAQNSSGASDTKKHSWYISLGLISKQAQAQAV
jgi:hypothetical protein